MKVNILGMEYEIISIEETNDNLEKYPLLKDSSGYTDITTKKVYILKYKNTEDTFNNLDMLYRKTLRHELVHAFLYESGLFNNSNDDWAKNEEVVDWIAIQFEKLLVAFLHSGAISIEGEILRLANDPINNPINPPKVKEAKAFNIPVTIPNLSNKEIVEQINKSMERLNTGMMGGSG